jgi:hypothetical protein
MKLCGAGFLKLGERLTIPDGAPLVSDPQHPTQCWALRLSHDKVTYQRCRSRARGAGGAEQKCTCYVHNKLEGAAQKLRTKVAG